MNYSDENPTTGEGTPRRRFNSATKSIIEKYTQSICCLCHNVTYSAAHVTFANVNYGEAAHIKAVSNSWPRYDQSQSDEECRDASNGLWLCRVCHKKVDDSHNTQFYTAEYLYQIKDHTRAMTMAKNNQPFLAISPNFREEERIASEFRNRLKITWNALHQRDREVRYLTQTLYDELQIGANGYQSRYGGSWGISNPLRSLSPAHHPQQDQIMKAIKDTWQIIKQYYWVTLADYPRDCLIALSNDMINRPDDNYRQNLAFALTSLTLTIERYMSQPNQLYAGLA